MWCMLSYSIYHNQNFFKVVKLCIRNNKNVASCSLAKEIDNISRLVLLVLSGRLLTKLVKPYLFITKEEIHLVVIGCLKETT